MTDPKRTPAAQTAQDLQAMTDAQARDLHARLITEGRLFPPPSLPMSPRSTMPQAVEALRDALAGHAVAWGERAPVGSALAHYSNGLLFAGSFLASCERVEPDPLGVLTMFTTWAASFTFDVLTETGFTSEQAGAVLDELGEAPGNARATLQQLAAPMPQGAFMAAVNAFYAASQVLTPAFDPEELMQLFALAGHVLAGLDHDPPSSGEGMKA